MAVGPWRGCSLGCWKEAPPGPRAADPGQDPSAVPVSELRRWAEASWPGPGPQNQLPELTTGTHGRRGRNHQSGCVWVHLHVTDERNVSNLKTYFHYQSSMSVACAAGGAAAGGGVLLLWLVVVVGVGEDQTLRGRGRRWFSSSAHRLLQQRGEVQTVVQCRQLERACRRRQLPM